MNALNVYTVGFTSGTGLGELGFSSFPYEYVDDPINDGVVMLYSTVPGGSKTNYNFGRVCTILVPDALQSAEYDVRIDSYARSGTLGRTLSPFSRRLRWRWRPG